MRNVAALAIVMLAACAPSAQADQAGGGGRRSYDVGSFDSISLAGRHRVIVEVGSGPSVQAEGEPKVLDNLEIAVRGRVLEIGEKPHLLPFDFGREPPATVTVRVPALGGASIAGSGDVRIDRVSGGEFAGSVAGSGTMEIASLGSQSVMLSTTGSGSIRAAGQSGNVKLEVAGSGSIDAGALASRAADVSLTGSGQVAARASGEATVSLIGSGDVTVHGSAKCSVDKTGSGQVRCGS
jgi:hypothetical protein